MPNDRTTAQDLELTVARIRQSIRRLLTTPRAADANWRHAAFNVMKPDGTPRADMTEQAIERSALHVIGEGEPRVTDLVVKPKLKHGKLASVAVSYTIKTLRRRDTFAIAY